MDDPQEKSAEFRRRAEACLDVAKRMSLRDDRACMTEMAQRWLDLAQQAGAVEHAETSGQQQQDGNQPPRPQPEPGQQPALQQQQDQPKDDRDK